MENDLYILSEKFFYYYVKETKPTHPPPIISRHEQCQVRNRFR